MTDDIDKAERMGRARAGVMALAALVLLLNILIQYGNPHYVSADARGASWLVVIGLWLFMLWNGGGLRPQGRIRALVNDELSLQNRSRAVAAGFYTAVAAALTAYVVNWWTPIVTGDALKMVSGGAVAVALACYAALEWRQR